MADQMVPDSVKLFIPYNDSWLSATADPGFSARTQGQNTIYTIDMTSARALGILNEYVRTMTISYMDRRYMRNVLDFGNFGNSNNPKIRLLHPAANLELKNGYHNGFQLDKRQLQAIILQSRSVDQHGRPRYNQGASSCTNYDDSRRCHHDIHGMKLPFPVCAALQSGCGNCIWNGRWCNLKGTAEIDDPRRPEEDSD